MWFKGEQILFLSNIKPITFKVVGESLLTKIADSVVALNPVKMNVPYGTRNLTKPFNMKS